MAYSRLSLSARARMRHFLKTREKDYIKCSNKIHELQIEIDECKKKLETTNKISVGSHIIVMGYCDINLLPSNADIVITLSSTGTPFKVQVPIVVTTDDDLQDYQEEINDYERIEDDLFNYHQEEFERRVDSDRWR